jgi:hypothetical protein
MKRLITLALLASLNLAGTPTEGQGTKISVVNNSGNWLTLSRLGAPGVTVELQKWWDQVIQLPLVPNQGDSMQMIQVKRQETGFITSETAFEGFNGNFAQDCTLTVSDSKIQIRYSGAGDATKSGDTNTAATNNNSTPGNSGGGGYGGGSQGGNYPGTQANHGTDTDTSADRYSDGVAKHNPSAPKARRTTFGGATGVRVKITPPSEAAKLTPLEPPGGVKGAAIKKPGEVASMVSMVPPQPPAGISVWYFVWGAVIILTINFVLFKIFIQHKARRKL